MKYDAMDRKMKGTVITRRSFHVLTLLLLRIDACFHSDLAGSFDLSKASKFGTVSPLWQKGSHFFRFSSAQNASAPHAWFRIIIKEGRLKSSRATAANAVRIRITNPRFSKSPLRNSV